MRPTYNAVHVGVAQEVEENLEYDQDAIGEE